MRSCEFEWTGDQSSAEAALADAAWLFKPWCCLGEIPRHPLQSMAARAMMASCWADCMMMAGGQVELVAISRNLPQMMRLRPCQSRWGAERVESLAVVSRVETAELMAVFFECRVESDARGVPGVGSAPVFYGRVSAARNNIKLQLATGFRQRPQLPRPSLTNCQAKPTLWSRALRHKRAWKIRMLTAYHQLNMENVIIPKHITGSQLHQLRTVVRPTTVETATARQATEKRRRRPRGSWTAPPCHPRRNWAKPCSSPPHPR